MVIHPLSLRDALPIYADHGLFSLVAVGVSARAAAAQRVVPVSGIHAAAPSRRKARMATRARCVVIGHPGGRGGWRGRWVDRKSTRLNSSHVKISYAVF